MHMCLDVARTVHHTLSLHMCRRSEHPALIRFLGCLPEPSIGFISDRCSATANGLSSVWQHRLQTSPTEHAEGVGDAGTLPVTRHRKRPRTAETESVGP